MILMIIGEWKKTRVKSVPELWQVAVSIMEILNSMMGIPPCRMISLCIYTLIFDVGCPTYLVASLNIVRMFSDDVKMKFRNVG